MLRTSRTALVYAVGLGFVVNLLQLVLPLYMLQIHDRVISSRSTDTLLMLTLLAIGVIMFLGVIDYLRSRVFVIVGEKLARRMNAPVLQAAVTEALRAGSASAGNVMRDLQELRQFVTAGPVALPADALCAPLFLAALFLLHPAYGVVALLSVAVLLGLGVLTEYLVRRPAAEVQESAVRSQAEVAAAIRHAEVIESMGMLGALIRRWQVGQSRTLRLLGTGTNRAKAIGAITRTVRMGVQVVVLATGALLVIDRQVTPGALMAAMIILARLIMPFEQMIEGWRQWTTAFAAFSRLRSLLVMRMPVRVTAPMEVKEGRLSVERLSYAAPGTDKMILRGVSFSVGPGEVIGIVGPTAAGKSTLARLLTGAFQPTSGNVFLDGHSVSTWERGSIGRAIGYVPQSVTLFEGTIRDNISRFTDADLKTVIDAAMWADIHEMVGRLPLGYETRLGEGGFTLSGGQRQRLSLARAVFGPPRILILDEPNSQLDSAGEQALRAVLHEAKRRGLTVVLIAHRPSMMEIADSILVLKEGVIEQQGPRAEVLQALVAPRPAAAKILPRESKIARLPLQRKLSP